MEFLPEKSSVKNSIGNPKSVKEPFTFFFTQFKYNISVEPNEVTLYSRKAIYFFTAFFSVFFGGTLLLLNFRKLKNTKGQIAVLIFTILYGSITFLILAQFKRNTGLTVAVGLFGAFVFINYFWKKYVGESQKYKAKPIWIPLIIALTISSLFIYLALLNNNELN